MYRFIVLPFLVILGLATVRKVSNYPYLLLGNYVINILNRFASSSVLVSVGGISLYNNDLTVFFLLFSLLAHFNQFHIRKKNGSIAIYALMVLCSLVVGLLTYGVNSWLVYDIKIFAYNIILIVFCAFVDCEIDYEKVYVWIKGVAYCVVAYIYFAVILHAATGVQIGAYTDARPLVSHYAITLVVFIIYEVYKQLYLSERPSISVSSFICMVAIIINRYNTTWVAMFLGLVLLVVFMPNKRALFNQKFVVQLFAITIIGVFAFTTLSKTTVMDDIVDTQNKFNTIQESNNTFAARVEVWGAMLASLESETEWIFGKPMGSGYYVNYRGALWEYNPHNAYVETIMRIGLIGCIAMIFMNIKLIYQAFIAKKRIIIAIMIPIMAYWITYTYEFELSCLFGLFLHMVTAKGQAHGNYEMNEVN